jgi:type II secretory pathway pseudopilin PulG
MKKSLLILTALTLPLFIMAQGKSKQEEIGLVFGSLNNFGLTYKVGTEKGLWRFTTLYLSGNNQKTVADSLTTKNITTGFGLKIGREWRKTIIGNLEFRYGADISFAYNYSKNETDDKFVEAYSTLQESTTYIPGVDLVLGFNYVFLKKFVVGFEAMPYFNYITGTSKQKNYYSNNSEEVKSKISGFTYGLSNTSLLVSLVYRFGSKK